MKMKKSLPMSLCFVWYVLGFLSAACLIMVSGAQNSPARPEPAIGTYQIEPGDGGVYLLNTRTGQLWMRSLMFYYDLGTPEAPIYKSSQLDR